MTNNDVDIIEGNHQEIYEKLQKHDGDTRDHAKKASNDFLSKSHWKRAA